MIDARELNNAIECLESEVQNIKKLSKIIDNIEKLNKDVSLNNESYKDAIERIRKIKNENISFNKELISSYNELENELLTQLQNIRNENKKSHLEFDEILSSRLDRNKSDIQITMHKNNNKVIDDIEDKVSSKILELNNNIKVYNDDLNKKIAKQNKLMIVLIVMFLLNIGLRFI